MRASPLGMRTKGAGGFACSRLFCIPIIPCPQISSLTFPSEDDRIHAKAMTKKSTAARQAAGGFEARVCVPPVFKGAGQGVLKTGVRNSPASERGTVQAPRRAPPEEHFTSRRLNAGFAGAGILSSRTKPVSRCAVGSALRCGACEKGSGIYAHAERLFGERKRGPFRKGRII